MLFFILGYCLHFYSRNSPKSGRLKKIIIASGDIIILHKCTKNQAYMLYCSWDMANEVCYCYFSFWAIFCSFTTLTAWKIKISKKWKKNHLEIWSITLVYQKKSYAILFLTYGRWHIQLLFFILGYLLPFYPPNGLKNVNFGKMKQAPQDIIILRNCTKNYDYRLNCSWDMVHGECNFHFSFLAIFFPFTRMTAQKLKISKKWKKHHWEVSSFYRSVPKIMIICLLHCFWDTARDGCICCFHFGNFFALLFP